MLWRRTKNSQWTQLSSSPLGELADERSLDVLLRLANEDGHALQDVAAEAIGHMGKSEKSAEILDLLKRLVHSKASVASRALIGLRWFDTPSAWDLLREKVREQMEENDSPRYLQQALDQLGYNDDPATKSLLLDALKTDWAEAALAAAKRLFSDESLEPDYALLQLEDGYYADSYLENKYRCLERVSETGEPARILEILNVTLCNEELGAALPQRNPLPIEEAKRSLVSVYPEEVAVAASIVGRVGKKQHADDLGSAITKWVAEWNQDWRNQVNQSHQVLVENEWIEKVICRLVWAAGRTSTAKNELLTLLQTNVDIGPFAPIRRAVLQALGELKLTKRELAAIEKIIADPDFEIRHMAADILARQDADLASTHASAFISDRSSFRRATALQAVEFTDAIANSASHAHYQAIVLPQLVANTNVDRLAEVANDANLADGTRLGAIEGLAKIANPNADRELVNLGKSENSNEDLRKAAWRGLRRSQRS